MTCDRLFRYEQLAANIEKQISDGTYKIGEKLPSIRDIHASANVSISTVFKAYVELEKKGLVEARPKSGYYVSGFTKTLKNPTFSLKKFPQSKVDLSSIVHTVHNSLSDPAMLPLGGLMISPELLPAKSFSRIFKKMSPKSVSSSMQYGHPSGHPELRRQVAQRIVGTGKGVSPDDIIITNGCMEALALSLQAVVKPGDAVIIERPTFFMVLQLLSQMDIYVVEIPTDPLSGMDLETVRKTVEKNNVKACLTMPNFHNPLGALMPDSKKRELVSYLNEKNIPIIEDDIYSELYFGETKPLSLKTYDQKDLVISCSSFSKTLAPGFRVGWVIPGHRFFQQIQEMKTKINVSSSSLDQFVLTEFLSEGGYERHLRHLRSQVSQQVTAMAQAVQTWFPKNTRLMIPKGGAFLWIQLPDHIDCVGLYSKALEQRIAILPGLVCSASPMFIHHIRLSCGYPVTEELLAGIKTLGHLMAAMA